MPFTTLDDGCRLNYRLEGPAGAPIVMLSNSLGTNLDLWGHQLGALEPHLQVLRYDSRGHGASDAPDGDYTIDRLGQDALDLLDRLDIAQVSFGGVSMGGAVGQWVAANAPERITRLVIANSASKFGAPEMWAARAEAVRRGGMAAVVDGVIERWFTPEFRQRDPDRVDEFRAMILATPPQGYAGCCAALRDTDLRALLPAIKAPTLIIAGRHDMATPLPSSEEMAAAIPHARLEVLDAAHLSAVEQTGPFNTLLAHFLE